MHNIAIAAHMDREVHLQSPEHHQRTTEWNSFAALYDEIRSMRGAFCTLYHALETNPACFAGKT